nr:hypothetical protein [Tanacetum cinerariifolium]
MNDVTRLQALVDKKKVVVTEATIREALYLVDAEGVDCLPRGNFYRVGSNGIRETLHQAHVLQSFILEPVEVPYPYHLAMHERVGKGFSGVETPLFEGMLVEQEIDEEEDADEYVEEVNDGDDAHGEVLTVQQTTLQSPQVQPPLPQPQPQQQATDFLMSLLQEAMDTCAALTRRVEHLEYDKVAQALEITKLKRRVKKLEKRNNVRVLKLKRLQRVGTSQRVETSNDTMMDDASNQRRMIAEMDQDDAVVLKDDKEEDTEVADAVKDVEEAKVDESAQDQGRQAESQAEIYKIDMDHANKVLSMQEDKTEPADVQEVVDVVTTAKLITKVVTAASETVTAANAIITTAEAQVPAATLTAAPARVAAAPIRRRKGVVIRDPELESTTSTIIPAETKSKDKGKGILAKKDPAVKRYQVLKRKPQTEAQARKNMIMYLKNVVGFKMDYFKRISYDDIRLIFEAKFNSNVAFLLKTKEKIEGDENRALQKLNETLAERATKRRKLDEEVEELRRHLQVIEMKNKPCYKIIRADDTHQLYVSFLSLLKIFDREDLEALWSLVKEIFSTTKPNNVSDDFLIVTLRAMFEKPNIHAKIWKTQRNEHGPAKVKGWKLLESCGVQIITFTSTQLIFLVERKYPLTRFTLDQMLSAIRLEVKEESEVSLELLRFTRQQHQEGQLE